jgi:hypothetical protein
VVQALNQRNPEQPRSLMAPQLQQSQPMTNVQQLMTCLPLHANLQVADRRIETKGNTAQAHTTLRITTPNGVDTQVQQDWPFMRQPDGT